MVLVIKFQGDKTLSIYSAPSYGRGNWFREVQWLARGHPAGHCLPTLAHSKVTLLLWAAF